jgi:myo-inositol-1(or 4)-monophosphatase
MPSSLQKELSTARQAAQAGGEVVARYFREGVAVRQKNEPGQTHAASYNLVTDADVNSERAIEAVIRQAFPTHALLGEETLKGDVTAEHLWVIDPLDGTSNFAHQIPHFAISIAYYRAGVPACGVILNPLRDDWFEAVQGGGATYNGSPVRVATHRGLDEVFVGVGFYYDRGAMMEATLAAIGELFGRQIHGIRRFGTASLDLTMVGRGSFGAFFEYELSPWDFAAGRLFVEEAGGRVTNCTGDELKLATGSVLATNGLLHDCALEIVSRHSPAS